MCHPEYTRFNEHTKKFFDDNPRFAEEALYLYNQGDNDKHIAKKLNKKFGLNLIGRHIIAWRKANDLTANYTYGNRSCEIDERIGEKIIALNKQGLSTQQIANQLHMSYSRIQRWRLNNKVYSRAKGGRPVEDETYRYELYQMGLTDEQMSAKINVSIKTISSWRRRRGLAPNK